MGRQHLDHWAEVAGRHAELIDFIRWLNDNGIEVDVYRSKIGWLSPRELANAYLEVDEAALDDERRELLESARGVGAGRRRGMKTWRKVRQRPKRRTPARRRRPDSEHPPIELGDDDIEVATDCPKCGNPIAHLVCEPPGMCVECGWCEHLSITGGVCNACHRSPSSEGDAV